MPVVTCPKCPTKLKVPDGASGNVKCPKCGTVFPVSAPAAGSGFEVVDDKPSAPAAGSRPVMKPVPQKAEEPEFEDEKPKKRSRDDDDDDDDDRPRKKKRSRDDDDDDDDEPRSRKKKRSRDDDDDDDDDRPRRKKGKKKRASRYDDDDDDDDDDWQPKQSSKGAAFAKAKTGAQLMSISFWLNLGAYGVLALYALIMWIMILSASSGSSSSSSRSSGDGSFMDIIVMLPGLAGLGAWIVGLVGTSFAIAGPKKARAMAITATVFAAVHLLLTGVTFSNLQDGVGLPIPGLRKIGWVAMATTLPAVDMFLPMLFYNSSAVGGDFAFALLAGICEIGRLVFMLLTLKALASAARDNDAAQKAQSGVMMASFITGGAAIAVLLVVVLIDSSKSLSLAKNLGPLTILLIFVAYTFMMLPAAMAAMQTRDACDR